MVLDFPLLSVLSGFGGFVALSGKVQTILHEALRGSLLWSSVAFVSSLDLSKISNLTFFGAVGISAFTSVAGSSIELLGFSISSVSISEVRVAAMF